MRTHKSLYYLASYLLMGGAGLLIAPRLALKLLFSTGEYGDVLPRMVGMLMVGLSIIVVQIIRLRVTALSQTTLIVRGFFLPCMLGLYFYSGDPLFLSVTAIVTLGFVWTLWSYLADRRNRPVGIAP